jgi:hypothetical protein
MRFLDSSWLLLVLAAAIGGGSVHAQAPSNPSNPPAAGAAVSKTVNVKLSAAEITERTSLMDATAREDMQHVLALQSRARKEQDVIKLNCINDKLVQLKAQLNIFDGTRITLSGAVDRGDEQRFTVFAELERVAEGIKALRGEADACVGEAVLKQESSTGVDRPDITDDPTLWDPAWTPDGDFEPPGYASPFN